MLEIIKNKEIITSLIAIEKFLLCVAIILQKKKTVHIQNLLLEKSLS